MCLFYYTSKFCQPISRNTHAEFDWSPLTFWLQEAITLHVSFLFFLLLEYTCQSWRIEHIKPANKLWGPFKHSGLCIWASIWLSCRDLQSVGAGPFPQCDLEPPWTAMDSMQIGITQCSSSLPKDLSVWTIVPVWVFLLLFDLLPFRSWQNKRKVIRHFEN